MNPADRNAARGLRFSLPQREADPEPQPNLTIPIDGASLTADHTADVYRADADGQRVSVECGACGLWAPVWGIRTIRIGHMVRLCRGCGLGRSGCSCDHALDGEGHESGWQWVPMTRKVNGCPLCAEAFDAKTIRIGDGHEPFLSDENAPAATRQQSKSSIPAEVLEFYGLAAHGPHEAAEPQPPTFNPNGVLGGIVRLSDEWHALMAAPPGHQLTEQPARSPQQEMIEALRLRLARVELMKDSDSRRIAEAIRIRISTLEGIDA